MLLIGLQRKRRTEKQGGKILLLGIIMEASPASSTPGLFSHLLGSVSRAVCFDAVISVHVCAHQDELH